MARFTMMAKFLSQPHQIRSLTTVDCWSPSLEENFRLNKVYNLEEEVKAEGVQNRELQEYRSDLNNIEFQALSVSN